MGESLSVIEEARDYALSLGFRKVKRRSKCRFCGAFLIEASNDASSALISFRANGDLIGFDEWFHEKEGVCNACATEMLIKGLLKVVPIPPYEAKWKKGVLYLKIGHRTFGRAIEQIKSEILWDVPHRLLVEENIAELEKITSDAVVLAAYSFASRKKLNHVNPPRSFDSDLALFSVVTKTDYTDLTEQLESGSYIATDESRVVGIMDKKVFTEGKKFVNPVTCRNFPYRINGKSMFTRINGETFEYVHGSVFRKAFGSNIRFCVQKDGSPIMIIIRKYSVVLHAPRIE